MWQHSGPGALGSFATGAAEIAKVAAGWYGDAAMMPAQAVMGPLDNLLPDATGLGSIDSQWLKGDALTDKIMQPPSFDSLGALDSTQQRLHVMNGLTQNSAMGSETGTKCGSTALLAAAIYAGGDKGVETLVAQARAGLARGDKDSKAILDLIQGDAAGHHLSTADLDQLNGVLFDQLRAKQAQAHGAAFNQTNPGLDVDTMQNFIAGSPEMKKWFADGKMSLDSVDADNKNGADHYTLSINGADGFVYDPFARKDGNQLVFNPLEVKNYHQHEDVDTRIDAHDFS